MAKAIIQLEFEGYLLNINSQSYRISNSTISGSTRPYV